MSSIHIALVEDPPFRYIFEKKTFLHHHCSRLAADCWLQLLAVPVVAPPGCAYGCWLCVLGAAVGYGCDYWLWLLAVAVGCSCWLWLLATAAGCVNGGCSSRRLVRHLVKYVMSQQAPGATSRKIRALSQPAVLNCSWLAVAVAAVCSVAAGCVGDCGCGCGCPEL